MFRAQASILMEAKSKPISTPLLYRGPTVTGKLATVGTQSFKRLCDAVCFMDRVVAGKNDSFGAEDDSVILEIALRHGVTDPVAGQLICAAHKPNLSVYSQRMADLLFVMLEGKRNVVLN